MSSRRRQSTVISSSSNKRKKAPANSVTRIRLPPFLKPGAAVEISSDETGFRGSWYLGKVVTVPSESTAECEVEYTTLFFDKEGRKRLKEVVDVAQLRPPVPAMSEREKRKDIEVGEEVDAFYSDGWWEGTVTEVLGGGRRFSVYFRASKEQIRFRRDELRFHREWVNGAWKPPIEETEEEEEEEDEGDETEEEEVRKTSFLAVFVLCSYLCATRYCGKDRKF